jgi:hypothetical protein
MVDRAGRCHPFGRNAKDFIEIRPSISALLVRMGRHMGYRGADLLARQSASHMQAHQLLPGPHLPHGRTFAVQPFTSYDQGAAWSEGRIHYEAPVPLPELGLGRGGWSGNATSSAAIGRSRVDAVLAQARVRTPPGK